LPKFSIITPTYINDFDNVKYLCESIDAFCILDYIHYLVVPASDVNKFKILEGGKRVVLSKESVLKKHGFYKLPFPSKINLFGLYKKIVKEKWYLPGCGILSGWLVQQLIKISALDYTSSEYLIFVDSDVILTRDFTEKNIFVDGDLKFFEKKIDHKMKEHLSWWANACQLLGVNADSPGNYIGQFVFWKACDLKGMINRIESNNSMHWSRVLSKLKVVSEYILYGCYIKKCKMSQGYFMDSKGLTTSIWNSELKCDLDSLKNLVQPEHVAFHLQSVMPLGQSQRDAIYADAKRIFRDNNA
jgi:hypothetical protein